MAPEQIERPLEVDHRADIYSLGVVFYQMLTGELPIGHFSPPSRKVWIDVRLDEVVLRALEKEPDLRYQQAGEVKTQVETIARTPLPGGTSAPVSPVEPGIVPQTEANKSEIADTSTVNSMSDTRKITAPAVGLIVVGLWELLSDSLALFVFTIFGLRPLEARSEDDVIYANYFSVVIGISLVFFRIIPGMLIMFGGFQMLQRKSYAWAIASGIISIVACSLIGFPVGIWALIVLAQNDVQSAFGSGVSEGSVPPASSFPSTTWERGTKHK